MMLSFNQVEFLSQAMHSVLNQEFVDLELIVVDPGSTDGSREVAQQLASSDKRVVLIFESDKGPSDGLNKGFAIAKNEIIGYLNSDDLYLQSALKNIEIAFNSNSEIDVIYGHGLILDERKKNKLQFAFSDKLSKIKIMTNTIRIMQQSTFFRKTSLEESQIYFNTMNFTCWDFEFIVDAFLAGLRFAQLKDILGVLRIHSNSITGGNLNFEKYIADKKRITNQFSSDFRGMYYFVIIIFAVFYRVTRKVTLLALRIRYYGRIKEFARNENISFME